MVASSEASYHSNYTGPGPAPRAVASAVSQSPMLRSVLCLVECSAVIILKFLIIFNKEACIFILQILYLVLHKTFCEGCVQVVCR